MRAASVAFFVLALTACSAQSPAPERTGEAQETWLATPCNPAPGCENPPSWALACEIWGEEVGCGRAEYDALIACAESSCVGPCGSIPPAGDVEDILTQWCQVDPPSIPAACGQCIGAACMSTRTNAIAAGCQ